ncbi:MAG: phosphoribosyltransferase family protein [Nitrospirota bacterium]
MSGWAPWREALFADREEAGRLLADRLRAYRGASDGLILALPRGGVAVGYTLSLALRLPLDVFLVRKLGAPGNPEFAIGAMTETGSVHLNPGAPEVLETLSAPAGYLEHAVRIQKEEIARRQALYRKGRPLPSLADRTVLLVDDGIATGATFLASVEALKGLGVKRLVAAIPVGPADTLREVGRRVDELVVLMAPEPFFAVGNHYADFSQVEDEKVIRYMAEAAAALREGGAAPERKGEAS